MREVEECSANNKVKLRDLMECAEVRMLARVTTSEVKFFTTENLRFPQQRQSAEG